MESLSERYEISMKPAVTVTKKASGIRIDLFVSQGTVCD